MAKRTSSDSEQDSASGVSEGSESKKAKTETIRLLREMLQERDQRVNQLSKEKKSLQQVIRRQNSKIDKLREELDFEKTSKQKDLDVKRVADKTGDLGKHRSWLLPSGAVSLAASSLNCIGWFYFSFGFGPIRTAHKADIQG